MSSGGTSTTTTQSGPPAEFLDAYKAVNSKANDVASTPYQPYQGNIVAPFSPGQIQGMQDVQNVTANGGVQQPYLDAATKSFLNAQTPLWDNVQQFSPNSINQYQSPYTQDVVHATENEFNNQNAQQQQQVIGGAIGKGAWGGDRSAVAQGITAGQQQLAEAPVLANLENQGYTQALGEFNNQQAAQIGANEANAWLGSQAGFGFGNLGQEAQSTGLQNANADMGIGNMQQGMAQTLLNVPYEQYTAAQALPYQQTGWLANIAEGLGGASGGNSSTSAPGPNVGSQIAGLGIGALGVAGKAGAFNNIGGGGGGSYNTAGSIGADFNGAAAGYATGGHVTNIKDLGLRNSGGGITLPHRAMGGMTEVPDVALSVVPGASGMGSGTGGHGGSPLIFGSTGSTSASDDGGKGDMQSAMQAIQIVGMVASMFANKGGAVHMPKRAAGGMSSSAESPWWERSEARDMDRHGLLSSPVAGRTDQLAISPAAGSYVVPADVVSGLGEGNTLAGANIMQRILDTGPHGLKMPVSSHNHMGPPRPPPAYNENTDHISNTTNLVPNAAGGMVPRRAVGGYTSLQDFIHRGDAPPPPPPPPTGGMGSNVMLGGKLVGPAPGMQGSGGTDVSPNIGKEHPTLSATWTPSATPGYTGINPSTGQGTSQTGLPALDAYLNNTMKGASYVRPAPGKAVVTAAPAATTDPNQKIVNALTGAGGGGGENGAGSEGASGNESDSGASGGAAGEGSGGGGPGGGSAGGPGGADAPGGEGDNGLRRGGYLPRHRLSGGMIPRREDGGSTPDGSLSMAPPDDSDDTVTLDVDSTPDSDLPVPPIPPAMPPGDSGSPAGMAPPGARGDSARRPPMPPRDSSDQGSKFHGAQADPWMALAEAGFGMAAGKSPFALSNIGAGAKEGIQAYSKQINESNKQNLQSDIWGGKQALGQDKNAITQQMNSARSDYLKWKADHGDASLEQQNAKQEEVARNHDLLDAWRNGVLSLNTARAAVSADQGQQKIDNSQTNAERMYNLNIQKAQNGDAFKQAQIDLNGMKLSSAQRARVDSDTRALVGQGMKWNVAQDIVLAREHLAPGAVTATPTPKVQSKPYGASSSAAPTPLPFPASSDDAVDGGLYQTRAGPRKWDAGQQGFVNP